MEPYLDRDFYHIVSTEKTDADTCCCRVVFHPEHPFFGAHFPGHPIVPGACLVQMAASMAASLLPQGTWHLQRIKSAKFLALIDPTTTPTVSFTFHLAPATPDNAPTPISCVVTQEGTTYAKMSICLTPEEPA